MTPHKEKEGTNEERAFEEDLQTIGSQLSEIADSIRELPTRLDEIKVQSERTYDLVQSLSDVPTFDSDFADPNEE